MASAAEAMVPPSSSMALDLSMLNIEPQFNFFRNSSSTRSCEHATMVALGERLHHAMKARSVSIAKLAKDTDVSYQGIRKIVRGETASMNSETLSKVSQYLRIRSDWLSTGEGDMDASASPSMHVVGIDEDTDAPVDSIRVMRLRLRAGVSGFAVEPDEDEAEPIFFRTAWLKRRGFKPYDLVATRVGGHSMEPTLYHDDLVVIHVKDTEPKDGEVYSVNYEGEAVIKRLVRDGGGWELASDNSDKVRYPNKRWLDGNAIIIGRVVHRQSERI